jgi:hypothetical protein
MMSVIADNRRVCPRNQIDCLIQIQPVAPACAPEAGADSGADTGANSDGLAPTTRGADKEVPALPSSGIVQDASASGARVWADRPYGVDEELILRFQCEKIGLTEERRCRALVVWADSQPMEGRWQIGVRFYPDSASATLAAALAQGCPWCEKLCPEIAAPDVA